MQTPTEQNQQLTPEQRVWAAQVHLAAAMTLWYAAPADEKQELLDEVIEQYDAAHIWAYAVFVVESLGFQVEPLKKAGEDYEPEANASEGLVDGSGPTGFYL